MHPPPSETSTINKRFTKRSKTIWPAVYYKNEKFCKPGEKIREKKIIRILSVRFVFTGFWWVVWQRKWNFKFKVTNKWNVLFGNCQSEATGSECTPWDFVPHFLHLKHSNIYFCLFPACHRNHQRMQTISGLAHTEKLYNYFMVKVKGQISYKNSEAVQEYTFLLLILKVTHEKNNSKTPGYKTSHSTCLQFYISIINKNEIYPYKLIHKLNYFKRCHKYLTIHFYT